jgi:glycosyltransferase involved in cell wall biosynthesis
MRAEFNAIILSEGHTATTDYYLVPHLESLGYSISFYDSRTHPPAISNLSTFQLIVISRYISRQWLRLLKNLPQPNVKIIYFMDDDLFDIRALQGLPKRYQWKIFTKALIHRSCLQQLCDEFWVSTPYLAQKYAQLRPILLKPVALFTTLASKEAVRVCYHGTSSHQAEIEWLFSVIAGVQTRSDNIHFELFGSQAVAKAVNKLPRVSVLHQMNWSNYLSFTSTQKRDIALAPLLEGAFNAARGPTKFYDYARMDAVGLYSDISPYRDFIRNGVDGFLLSNEPSVWIEKLLELANDKPQRDVMSEQIRQRLFQR